MAEKSGFYPSTVANPRKYGNNDMNMPYKKIIRNGVFATPQGTPSNELQVMESDGLNIVIKAGNGVFNDKWYENTTDINRVVLQGSAVARTDYVVVRCDDNESVKRTYVLVKTGDTTSGTAPALVREGKIYEYLLAKIVVPALSLSVTQDMIEDCRGGEYCPWVTSLVDQVDTSTLWIQFNTAFNNWFADLRENLTTTVMLTQKTAQVITSGPSQSVINIPDSLYFNINLDILNVYIEGRKLIQDVDYTKQATTITLTIPLELSGAKLEFEVIKNIDATDVETYVERLYNLETIVGDTKITTNTGTAKLNVSASEDLLQKIVNEGIGVHTFFSASGATNNPKNIYSWRGIAQMTAATNGYVLAISYNKDVYVNCNVTGVWTGWRAIYESVPNALWSGQMYMNQAQTITPSKKLSECRTGWVLVWSGFENGTAVDNKYMTTLVPKVGPTGAAWNGQSHYAMVPITLTTTSVDSDSFIIKAIDIRDATITGNAANNTGNRARVVLRAVMEY